MDVTIWLQIQKGADVRTGGKEGEEEEEGDLGPAWLSSLCQQVEGEGRGMGRGERRWFPPALQGQEWREDLVLGMVAH